MNTASLPTLEQLAVVFDTLPARVRAASKVAIREAFATGWRSTPGFNADILEIRGVIQLEVNEGACNYEAGCLAALADAQVWVDAGSTLTVERWRAACFDELATIVWGQET